MPEISLLLRTQRRSCCWDKRSWALRRIDGRRTRLGTKGD
jgi:hypothetical protein